MKKVRADILVVQQGIAESRAKAQAMILAGQILTTDGVRIEKAGQLLAEDSPLYFKGARLKFVSRGGLKLEVLEAFATDVRDLVASTLVRQQVLMPASVAARLSLMLVTTS